MKWTEKKRARGLVQPWICAHLWTAVVIASARPLAAEAQSVTISVVPDADAFVRAAAHASNYGGAGALSVSGSSATNGSGVQMGVADSLMRFPMSNAVTALDSALGGQDWIMTEARLLITEMAAPDDPIFNRGLGAFEVRWIAMDNWIEGTGKPMSPTSDGVAWQDLPQLLNSNLDVSLGVFTNSGANGQVSFTLSLPNRLVEDLRLGDELGCYFRACDPNTGFTFNSRSFGNTNTQPSLLITAAANPHPRIESVRRMGTSVAISFNVTSNWTYQLQFANKLSASGLTSWSNLLTVPPQSAGSNVEFLEGTQDPQRFYRLSASP